jgi:hypothetical protein
VTRIGIPGTASAVTVSSPVSAVADPTAWYRQTVSITWSTPTPRVIWLLAVW